MRELRTDDSSNVRRVAWRDDDTVEVEFASGAVYSYARVQKHQFAEACGAESLGAWVSKTLVKNPVAYPVTKVRGPVANDQEKKLDEQLKASVDPMRLALEKIADYEPDYSKGGGLIVAHFQGLARDALGRTS